MAHTYEELRHKTVAELREIASGIEHEALRGYTQLNKEHLLQALAAALGFDTHIHHKVVGINKTDIKAKIKALKQQRDEAVEAHDHARLKRVRRQLHRLKRDIHKATV